MATPKNRSVLKAFALLRAFGGPDEELTSAELSRRAGLPEASGYRLIQTLEAAGAVVRVARGRYRPGFLLTALSRQVSLPEILQDAAQGPLQALADRFGATAHLGVLEHDMVTYVAKAAAAQSTPVPTQAGAQQEAYCSAIGKALLAGLSDEALERFLRQGDLVALTEHTITDPAAFRDEIRRTRARGFAFDQGETHAHLGCIAVPLRDRQGGVLAALSLVDRREVLDEARSDQMRLALSLAAEAFEARIRPCLPARPASEPAAPPRGFAFRGDPALGPLLPS